MDATGPFGGQVRFGVTLPQLVRPQAVVMPPPVTAAQPAVPSSSLPSGQLAVSKAGPSPIGDAPSPMHKWGHTPELGYGWYHTKTVMTGLKFVD